MTRTFRNTTRRPAAFRPCFETLETRDTPSVSFGAPQSFATGVAPTDVVVADFNGDGKLDYATANETTGAVSVFVNTTAAGANTPTFAAAQYFPLGAKPVALVAGDFNGDGRMDLAVTNYLTGKVVVALNTTAPGSANLSFTNPVPLNACPNPNTMTAGDFNGDGKVDLAITSILNGTVSVMLNTTPAGANVATFAAPQAFAVGGLPSGVAAGDFNGDGKLDLAVSNYLDGTVSVLLNTTAAGAATPTFAAQKTFAVGPNPRNVVVGDFNGDGRPDLATSNGGNGTVSVLENATAAGSNYVAFVGQQTFATGNAAYKVAVGDFNGDGRPDLAVTDNLGNDVVVFVNTTPVNSGNLTFAAPQNFGAGNGPAAIEAGDFNGDGRADLVICDLSDNKATVLLNTTANANTTPVVVGQFGNTGVWEYNSTTKTWFQLTAANASLLAADSQGDVVGEFPGNGVWEYRPSTGWKQINGVDATALAINANGEIVASFPGYGVGEYLPAFGWSTLTPSVAKLLTIDALGDIAGAFPGYGIQLYKPATGWAQINGTDATLLAMDSQGDLVANFKGYGVGEYKLAGGWQIINGVEATSLAMDGLGDVVADFKGYGVGEYLPASGWRSLTPFDGSSLGANALGAAFGEFAGIGVWAYDPATGSWTQIRNQDAALLAVA